MHYSGFTARSDQMEIREMLLIYSMMFHIVSYIRTSEKLNQIQNRYLPSPQGKDNLLHFNCYVTRRIAAEKTQMV